MNVKAFFKKKTSVRSTKCTQIIWLSVENVVYLQNNSNDYKRIKSKWRYGMDETLNEIQSKTEVNPESWTQLKGSNETKF